MVISKKNAQLLHFNYCINEPFEIKEIQYFQSARFLANKKIKEKLINHHIFKLPLIWYGIKLKIA